MPSCDRKCVRGARKWRHAVCILMAIILVFTWSNWLSEKMSFLYIIMYVTICDLHGHRRSQVMVWNERLYMSSLVTRTRFTRYTFITSGGGYSKTVGYKRSLNWIRYIYLVPSPHLSNIYKIVLFFKSLALIKILRLF